MAKEAVSKSWFAEFNNPEKHGYEGTPHAICERLKAEWCCEETRTGAWAYCIKHYVGHYPIFDEDGKFLRYALAVMDEEKEKIPKDLPHVHMVLEDAKAMRFSFVKNTYAIGMHFEGTKGSKSEAEDYISKSGNYSEKEKKEAGLPWEEVIYVARHGVIRGRQGQRSDIQNISSLLREGKTPLEILSESFGYYRYESMIRSAYFDKRDRETPAEREVKVIWHTGASGSGKSYSRMDLQAREGESRVFYLSSYGRGMFDKYNGEPILWIEDFKGEIKFGDLLRYLDIYKCDLPARFKNGKALWTEVHITSVLHPLGAYRRMLSERDQKGDSADQLLRRIHCIRYHWKDGEGYHARDFPVAYSLARMEELSKKGLPDEQEVYIDPALHQEQFTELDVDDPLPF